MSERTCTPLSDNVEDPGKYCPGGLHPIHINDTLSNNRYLILHKLNRGSFSTVWLARDTLTSSYVALKINTASISLNTNESNILAHLASRPSTHPGREFVMTVKDEFVIDGPNGKNQVFVTDVAGGQLRRTEGVGCMDLKTPRVLARQLFMAVQYLHECGIVHGDLFPCNIVTQLSNFDHWTIEELYACIGTPTTIPLNLSLSPLSSTLNPHKPHYLVPNCNLNALQSQLGLPKVLIVDFGRAFHISSPPLTTGTPPQFAAPESDSLYQTPAPLTPAVDVWALACCTFEICSGYTLFKSLFNSRIDVLKDLVSMLGKPPSEMWECWEERGRWFDEEGRWAPKSGNAIVMTPYSLAERVGDIGRGEWEEGGEGRNVAADGEFATAESGELHAFLAKILLYDPAARLSPSEALEHPFLRVESSSKA